MDFEFESKWKRLLESLESQFGEAMELEAILFLIGVQELGDGARKFKKDEKLDLMHIAICTILEPYGYYTFSHYDDDRWPHFNNTKKLPYLNDKDQKQLMRKAVLNYFEKEKLTLE